ncbi:protein BCCIP homolog isoform X4 [Citrus sinensis]|uniref:protein BCCIP homolog isoform X4 n=1 Tax=Citrus sinensis TaxID=2711 RepID=UPI002278E03B|nr:protein BCCIP homolog isoform X4 [Citrus sinensis]
MIMLMFPKTLRGSLKLTFSNSLNTQPKPCPVVCSVPSISLNFFVFFSRNLKEKSCVYSSPFLVAVQSLKLLVALRFYEQTAKVAQIASIHVDRCQTHKSKDQKGSPLNSKDKGIWKHTLEGKNDLSKSSEEEGSGGVVQADFVFFDPKPDDFHGVKILLQTYLDDAQWDLSGFVDLILAQTTVGTVVKIEGDDDNTPFSIVTALNLRRYKDHKCIKELKEFLLKVCLEKDVIKDLRLFMGEQANDVGLLVSQRVVNLPPQLLPPLYDALFDEVSWATEDEPTEELRNFFRFKCYLLVSKIYKHKNANQKNNRNLKRRSASDSGDEIVYIKPEDEIFHKLKNYRLMGLVMAVEAAKIPTFRQELQSLIVET